MFILMLFALVLSVTSFAGSNWSNTEVDDGERREVGLWESCDCNKDNLPDSGDHNLHESILLYRSIPKHLRVRNVTVKLLPSTRGVHNATPTIGMKS